MSDKSEHKLIKNAVNGDSKAFEKLILPYEKKVYNIAMQMFKNEQDAYDASQEVLIKVYNNLDKFKFESAFSTWLHRLAMNTCIDEYRKRKRHMEHTTTMEVRVSSDEESITRQFVDHNLTPEQEVLQKETVSEVRHAMDQLKEDQKILIIYRDIYGYSYDEIAKMLECNLGTTKSRISRARQALKDIIIKKREQTAS